MKLTTIIILSVCLHSSANGLAQNTITFSGKEVSLENVFSAIKKQTSYRFFFNTSIIQQASKITIEVKNAPIEQVMNLALKDQSLTFAIKGRTIFIMKKPEEEKSSSQVAPMTGDPVTVSGKILDENGAPAQGVNVTVRGTNKGTTTNLRGEFEISGVNEGAVLLISSVGYDRQELLVKNKNFITTQLKVAVGNLDELQVIAYGTTSKRFNTGNVTTIKSTDIEKQPVNNPLLALQGRVPGLFITQNTGLPGGGVTVRIQGQNSIGNGNNPFYVIDGVPFTSQLLSTTYAPQLGGYGLGSPFAYINMNDIETVEILKDADATAIYGSRAANGAILITTKKGKAGKARVNINSQTGWGKITRKLELLNTEQYLQMRREAMKNDGIAAPASTDYDINGLWDTTMYTDWQDVLLGGTANFANTNVAVSGGNSLIQYMVGGTYMRESTVFPGNSADQKGSLHFNLSTVSSNQKFRFQITNNYLIDNNLLLTTDLTSTAITLAPNAPSIYKEDGTLNWMPNSTGTFTWINPLRALYQKYQNKTNNLITNVNLSYQLFEGLEIRTSFGYTNLQTNETLTYPSISQRPDRQQLSAFRVATYTNNNINTWIVEPQTSYKRAFGKLKLETLIGTTFQQSNSKGSVLGGSGFNSDAVLEDIRSASTINVTSTTNSVYKYNAIFGRMNYIYKDKYILNFTGRRDGSSRFGPDNQFHNFWAIGGGWIFSEEISSKKSLSFLSFGKVRGSYGTSGNDQIGDYKFMNLFSPYTDNVGVPYQNASSLTIDGLANPYLQWEETRKLQFGMDFGLFKDRILFTTNYAHNRSSNQLVGYILPSITGFNFISANLPATIQNTSWEFLLNLTPFKANNLTWNLKVNFTIPRNKLISFPDQERSSYATSLFTGEPISIIQAYRFAGVNSTSGIYQFSDKDGNITSSPNYLTDRVALINTMPKYYGGVENSIQFKGFELSSLFQFVKQIGNNYDFGFSLPAGNYGTNQPSSVLQRWRKTDDATLIQKFSSKSTFSKQLSTAQSSDAAYSDASFIRLKNVSLSWSFSESIKKKIHLQNGRIYLQGQNLVTITKFRKMDPENQSIYSLPPLKVLTVGVQVGL